MDILDSRSFFQQFTNCVLYCSDKCPPFYRYTATACACGTRKSTNRVNEEPIGAGSNVESTNRRLRSSFRNTMNIRLVTTKTTAPTGTAMPNFMTALSGVAIMLSTTTAIVKSRGYKPK